MSKIAQRQVLAVITPDATLSPNAPKWEGFRFAQISGGEITAAVEKIYQGGDLHPQVLCAPFEIGDITVTAHFDDDRTADSDGEAGIALKIKALRGMVGQAFYTLQVQTYDCDIENKKLDRTYSQTLLVGLTEAEGDASSGAPATFALTFAIQGIDA
jgi:hypothetical protein